MHTLNAGTTGLFNTGQNIDGTGKDLSWSIITAPVGVTTGNAYTASPVNTGWVDPANIISPNSRWITPQNYRSYLALQALPGDYIFQTSFTALTPIDLSFFYSVDNFVTRITLNGPTSYDNSSITNIPFQFTAYAAPITINDLAAGSYILSFYVNNSTLTRSPVGLRVDLSTQDIAVPEPSTYASMGGLLCLGLIIGKTRKSKLLN